MATIKLGEEPPTRAKAPSDRHQPRRALGLPPRPVGVPLTLTPEVIALFEYHLPTMAYLESVGDLVGVSRRTWTRWLCDGRAELKRQAEGDPPDPTKVLQAEFCLAFKRGMAEYKRRNLDAIAEARERDWRSAAWLMERRFPEQWGDKTREIAEMKRQLAELEKAQAAVAGALLPATKPTEEGA